MLQFCSALQPACHLAQLAEEYRQWNLEWPAEEKIVTAGEDWLDAYRYTPMKPDDALGCIVVLWHAILRRPMFQVYHGMLFGLPIML